MSRPQKKTVDYFPHFVSSESRTKFILEQHWGNDGYAYWFKLLELLGRSEGHCYDCSVNANLTYLTAFTHLEEETVNEIMNVLAELGSVDKDLWEQHRVIWCQSLVDNLQDVYSKRSVQAPTKPELDTVEAKEPDQPEEEKKQPAKKKRAGTLNKEQQELFDRFYSEYPKKVDRATAEKAWGRISPAPDAEKTDKIIEAVHNSMKYDSRFRDRQYIPNPASWLNAKGYENEFSEANNGRTYGAPGGFHPSGGFKV